MQRRYSRSMSTGFIRTSPTTRFFTMVAFLIVLVLLMQKTRDPKMWEWAVPKKAAGSSQTATVTSILASTYGMDVVEPSPKNAPIQEPSSASAREANQASPAADSATAKNADPPEQRRENPTEKTNAPPADESANAPKIVSPGDALNASPPKDSPSSDKPSAPAETVPIDQEPLELKEFGQNKLAITDGTKEIQPEEMHAYKQLYRWVRDQPLDVLQKRANPHARYNWFANSPNAQRGKLFALEVEVHQSDVCLLEGVDDQPNAAALVDASAFTEESRGRPYQLIIVAPPANFPIKHRIREKGVFYGYFLKQMGYESGYSKPDSPLLRAPVLIGRFDWRPRPTVDPSGGMDWLWPAIGGLVVGIFLLIRIALMFFGKTDSTFIPAGNGTRSRTPEEEVKTWMDDTFSGQGESEKNDDSGNNPGEWDDSKGKGSNPWDR